MDLAGFLKLVHEEELWQYVLCPVSFDVTIFELSNARSIVLTHHGRFLALDHPTI